MKKTTEFSFLLKPSEHGVGVFAAEDIAKDTHLRLFGDKESVELRSLLRKKEDVPTQFQSYCMSRGNDLICPKDFGCMNVGWYLNHSTTPNAYPDSDLKWYASRDIKTGEEIMIDYRVLNEPEEDKEDFYK